jgi:peroxiredoxin
MVKMLHQTVTQSESLRGRRFTLTLAFVAVLPVLAAPFVGFGFLPRATVQEPSRADGEDEVARLAGDYRGASAVGSLREIIAHPDVIPTHHHPLLGRQAPNLELADSDGSPWTLRELREGGPMVLIFYYGYHCDHCVRQLFEVNRDLALFRELGVQVAAISADPPELTRQRFKQHGPFGFRVLADPGNQVARAYQVFRGDLLRHATFVIDRGGTVQWANIGDAPLRRNAALLHQVARLQGPLPSAQADP